MYDEHICNDDSLNGHVVNVTVKYKWGPVSYRMNTTGTGSRSLFVCLLSVQSVGA
jgi:hypothetical protein